MEKFVTAYSGSTKLTSEQFYELFKKYDTDGNGYIEAGELDSFLKDVLKVDESATKLQEFKEEILAKYDSNYDGKIDTSELAKILPKEENFLFQFRNDNNVSSVDFMKIFKKYDTDKSGYIERSELSGFLFDLLEEQGKVPSSTRIEDYTTSMLELFDVNKDGKLELSEMAKILPVEQNFLKRFEIRGNLTRQEFGEVFAHYDKDGNETIEGAELDALLKDLLERKGQTTTTSEIESFRKAVLQMVDTNKDGKLQRDELAMLLTTNCRE